jgi:F1F0 ATPase subunit 2
MNIWSAWTTGFGIGLASIGGLWLSIRWSIANPCARSLLVAGHLLRLLLTAAGFYAVARQSPGFVVPAVAGFWVARRVLIRRWGGVGDA